LIIILLIIVLNQWAKSAKKTSVGAQNPIFPFYTIVSSIFAIFPRFNHSKFSEVLKPPELPLRYAPVY